MDESNVISFVIWSAITAMVAVISGLVYQKYLGKKNDKASSS
jgi:Tfp pilus assembly major pilin PilA